MHPRHQLTGCRTPTTDGTVSLILRTGANNDLDTVETIASNIPNSGTYDWSIPESAVRGSNYVSSIATSDLYAEACLGYMLTLHLSSRPLKFRVTRTHL